MTVRLVDISPTALEALAAGDREAATSLIALPIPEDFVAETDMWRYFLGLLAERPESLGWTARAVVHDDVIVGNAGFKGAPDADGTVEIGYAVLPEHRRRGYAVAAVRVLLERAAADPRVRLVTARVKPDNAASIAVVTSAGFVRGADFMHPRDGRQLLFTNAVGI